MKISVVMAVYNGEKHITEQLESIYNQNRKPDEVIIVDDRSSDSTAEIIAQFIREKDLGQAWHYYLNASNKGVVRNFLDGAAAASGDIVFYSDQDDVWDARKIGMMEQGFLDHSDMVACYCLRNIIDGEGNILDVPLSNKLSNVRIRTQGFQKIRFTEAVKYNKSPGLCLAIRKELIQETRDMILDNSLTHDLPIGTVASIKDGYYVLNQRLVNYRQHGDNVSSPRYHLSDRLSKYDAQIQGRKLRLKQMRVILDQYENEMNKKDRDQFIEAIKWTEKSIDALTAHDCKTLFGQVFTLNPMNNRWIAANNFLSCIKNKKQQGV